MTRRLVVSVHDVCPATWSDCRAILAKLDGIGVRRRSLLVIPAHAGGAVDEIPGFAAWLRERVAAGDELLQHGWRHGRAPDHPVPRGPMRWVDAALARGAGEFFALDAAEAAHRLEDGRRRLETCGLRCQGFCAPAWLYSPAAATAVSEAGFGYLLTHCRLRELPTGRSVWAFGLSNRPGPLPGDLIGRLVNELLALGHAAAPVIRVAVHPADLHHHRPFEHTLRLLCRLLAAGRVPCRYRDLLSRRP